MRAWSDSTGLLLALVMGGAAMGQGEPRTVECGRLRLGFDGVTGAWTLLALGDTGGNLLAGEGALDCEAELAGRAWPELREWRAQPPEVAATEAGWLVRVVREAGEWQVAMEYEVLRDEGLLERRATLVWRGEQPVEVRSIALRVPGVALGGAADGVWALPGNYPFAEQRLADARPGRVSYEAGWTWSDTGGAYAFAPRSRVGVLIAYSLQLDHAHTLVEEGAAEPPATPARVSLVTRFDTVGTFQPGDELEVGTQWVRVANGDREALRRGAADLATRANPGPPADRPEWLDGAVIEELHPWGRLEAWGAGDRGDRMPSIEAQLPYLRDLGVDGVWLLPVSNKPPWVYFLPAFRRLDPEVATAEQLRSFVAAGHRLGMHTLLDLVTYGISPDSPDVADLPPHVWCVNREGQQEKAWSGTVLAADLTEPDWNAHIVDLTSWWVRQFGADGFRLDCGGSGQALNWRPRTGRRANATLQAGGIRQNALIRQAIRQINPAAVLMPEAGATGYFASADLLFDYPLYMVCREITREAHTDLWVRRAREWLAAQQMTHSLAQQHALVRFLENHDTVAAQDFFAVGPSQALTALCALIPGTLLLYQEEEIGMAPELRRWLRLRHELPELRGGAADYLCLESSDPQVLPVLRYTRDQAAIVAINFGPHDTHCRLRWPERWAARLPECRDALTGTRLTNGGEVRIPAYRPLVATLRPEASRQSRTGSRPHEAAPLITERTEEPVGEGRVRHCLRFSPVREWFVQTPEGLLRDEFVDRHRGTKPNETVVDAVPPLWRCWRPCERGYWDGPGAAALGVIAGDGCAVELRVTDRARLHSARLDDSSSAGEQVAITLETDAGSDAFTVAQHADGAALLERLQRRPRPRERAPVEVDPLWVHVTNSHYEAALSRRHGGTLFDLRRPGAAASLLAGGSEVYTDWGLFERGLHVATEWETNPRLSVTPLGAATEVTFVGQLRRPSWNGVHAGYVIEPPVTVRLTYRVDASPTMQVTFGATPTSDRPDTSAFLAYRIPFAGVTEWEAAAGGQVQRGRPGDRAGERVFQGAGLPNLAEVALRLRTDEAQVRITSPAGTPDPPQNPFLLDGGREAVHLFVAMLNGEAVHLRPGEEIATSFAVTVERETGR